MTDLKRCRVCGQAKPADEFYVYSGRTCRACQIARAKAWNAAHRKRQREIQRRSHRRRRLDPKKREDGRLADRLYYLRHAGNQRRRRKETYWSDPEKARERSRRWKALHRDHCREYQTGYRQRRREEAGHGAGSPLKATG